MILALLGDFHVTPDTINECAAIIRWVSEEETHTGTMLMGDQFDKHGNVRTEVLEFWNDMLDGELAATSTIMLTGNHDMNYACDSSALCGFDKKATIVNQEFTYIDSGCWAIGYIKNPEEFLTKVNNLTKVSPDVKIIFCHQEFNGAQYENGFYAPGGVKIEDLPQGIQFVSGHIHMKQQIGPVLYVGTPRQIGRNDSDPDKCIWLLDTDTLQVTPVRVPDHIFERYKTITVNEGEELPKLKDSARTLLDIHGSDEFIKKTLKSVPQSVKVRTYPTRIEVRHSNIKESEGISKSFGKFVDSYMKTNNITADAQLKIIEKVKTLCPELTR